ncbi:hypothetical protein [Marinobacterium lutimaris]|nr:hypothetical protein [Marinobacterium lutimaris]
MKIIHMSFAKIYGFKSITFEWHDYLGPTFLRRKDYELRPVRSIPLRQWGELGQWMRLSDVQREEYRRI